MDIGNLFLKFWNDLNVVNAGLLAGIWWSLQKFTTSQKVKNKEVEGRFAKNEFRFEKVEENVTKTQGEIKEIRKNVESIKRTTDKINWKLEDKEKYGRQERYQEEIGQKEARG